MKLTLEPISINLRIGISGGVLYFTDKETKIQIEIEISDIDLKYLKNRLNECHGIWETKKKKSKKEKHSGLSDIEDDIR